MCAKCSKNILDVSTQPDLGSILHGSGFMWTDFFLKKIHRRIWRFSTPKECSFLMKNQRFLPHRYIFYFSRQLSFQEKTKKVWLLYEKKKPLTFSFSLPPLEVFLIYTISFALLWKQISCVIDSASNTVQMKVAPCGNRNEKSLSNITNKKRRCFIANSVGCDV